MDRRERVLDVKPRRTAIHEGGHVCGALVYGIPVVSVTVDPRRPHFLRGAFRQTRDLAIESLVVICLAGPAGEQEFFGPIDDGGDIIDLRMARTYLEPHYPPLMIGWRIDHLRGAAQRLVRDAKPQIKLIADALLQHGALKGDEVYELLSNASRRPATEYGDIHNIGGQV
jgi:hypothetical protein